MEGHRYFINGIPLTLWKEFRLACIYFNTTAKDHLIGCMQEFVVRYHRAAHNEQVGASYKLYRRKKK